MPKRFIRKGYIELLSTIKMCVYCGATDQLVIDHIVPIIKGGTGELHNLTKSCVRCNSMKSDFDIEIFLDRIISKRDEVFNKFFSYTFRLGKHKRRQTQPELQDWLRNKIRECRNAHSYYTRIINSITNRNYVLTEFFPGSTSMLNTE